MNWEHGERRKGTSVEDIVKAAVEALKRETSVMSPDEHQFIQMLIQREHRREERWEKVKAQVLGWGIIAFAGFLGTVLWDSLIRLAKS